MYKRMIASVTAMLYLIIYILVAPPIVANDLEDVTVIVIESIKAEADGKSENTESFVTVQLSDIQVVEEEPETIEIEETDILTEEEICLIALITMAEAEGESEYGKRLVIDTILNRVDSAYFPDTVHGVIYQKNQFSSVWNGRVDRCSVMDDICDLVREELQSRTNYEVMFFTAGHYGAYGTPLFQVGNHYFSSYK